MKRFDSANLQANSFQYIDTYINSFSEIESVSSDHLYGDSMHDVSPWLSILIPTFCRKTLFEKAIASVLVQETVDFSWEILVVDNTPIDENGDTPALEIIRQIGDARINYYHNRENIGTGYNWNRGVALARGEWVCFLHDDDVLCPDALKNIGRQINQYQGKRPLGYLHARRINFSTSFQADSHRRYPPERLTRLGMTISGPTGAGAPTCGTTIRRSAYLEVGGICYDYACSADAVLCCQMMKHYSVICSDRVLGGCRWGDNESLKRTSLLGMIQSDELLSKFLYQRSALGLLWEKIFGAAIAWQNIHRKQKIAEWYHIEVTKEDFQAISLYQEPSKVKKGIFFAVYAIYRFLRMMDGWGQQLLVF